jgi:hypothetical protein
METSGPNPQTLPQIFTCPIATSRTSSDSEFQEANRFDTPQRTLQPLNEILTTFANMSEENIYDEIEIEVRSLCLVLCRKALFADNYTILRT